MLSVAPNALRWAIVVDLSRDEKTIAKRYPAHTSFCIREGWEFSRPEHAVGERVVFYLVYCFFIFPVLFLS